MEESLREGLERLRALSPVLNDITNKAGRVVQAVEDYLNEVCLLGIPCFVQIRSRGGPDVTETDFLEYGRLTGKFRIFVSTTTDHNGDADEAQALWANCPRELKLLAYAKVPDLVKALTAKVEETIEQFESDTTEIESLIGEVANRREQQAAAKKKEVKS